MDKLAKTGTYRSLTATEAAEYIAETYNLDPHRAHGRVNNYIGRAQADHGPVTGEDGWRFDAWDLEAMGFKV